MNRFALADRLHQTLSTIDAMPMAEFTGWIAYFRIVDKK